MFAIRNAIRWSILAALATMSLPAVGQEAAHPTDYRLELIVRGAYLAATGYAQTHGNYFAQDGEADGLVATITSRMAVPVEMVTGTDLDALRKCGVEGGGMRLIVNVFGDGIGLAAADADRVVIYVYEPRVSGSVVVTPPADCVR